MRYRSPSYSPPPRRGHYRRRSPNPPPRGRYGGRSRAGPTTLLVRNIRRDSSCIFVGRMTFEVHLGSLGLSKTFISRETIIQESLVVLVSCSIMIPKMQQKQNITWIDRFFSGERLLLYLLKRVERSQRKCRAGREVGLDMAAIVPHIMNVLALIFALVLGLMTAQFLQGGVIQGHVLHMGGGIVMIHILTHLYLGLPVQEDIQGITHYQGAGRHLSAGPTLSHQIGMDDVPLLLRDIESDQDRLILVSVEYSLS